MKSNISLNKLGVVFLCVLIAFLYQLLFSQTLSPLYTIEQCDSSVFKLMGLALLKGKVPYVDLFDHKGPMLYSIEAFGQWLVPGRNGLFLLSVIGLSLSVFCWYKSARLFTTPLRSFFAIVLTLYSYYFYGEYGNLTEDWNVPFISVAYYLILLLLANEKSRNYLLHGVAIGLCLACSFFIRPNDAVAFIGAPAFGIFVWMLRARKFQELFQWSAGIAAGFAVIAMIFIAWFSYHNALSGLWYGLIGFNAKYATGIKGLLKGCMEMIKLNYVPFLMTLLVLVFTSNNRRILFPLVPSVSAALVLLGNNAYPHYWIAWIPVIFFSYWLYAFAQDNKAFSVLAVCVFLSSPLFAYQNWLRATVGAYKRVGRDLQCKDPMAFNTKDLFQELNVEDKDSIWSYNLTWHGGQNVFNVLLYNEIIPCNRVPLIFMALRDESLYESMDLIKACPKYILYSPHHMTPVTYQKDSAYIEENYFVYKESIEPQIIMYKRKQ